MMPISNYEEKYDALIAEINSQKKFGLDCKSEEFEAQEIENILIDKKLKFLNDEFVRSHCWITDYLIQGRPWRIIIHNQKVYRIKDIYRTYYDEGTDTYNYEAVLLGLFINEERTIQFDYYYQAQFLAD